MQNLFSEIDFVGTLTLTLDVNTAAGISPSASFINPYNPTGSFNGTLSVSGQISDTGHRQIILNQSVDLDKLQAWQIEHGELVNKSEYDSGYQREAPAAPSRGCDKGGQLGGAIGITENLAANFIGAAMNDISLWPETPKTTTSDDKSGAQSPGAPTGVDQNHLFDEFTMQTDFTISEQLGGGPTWSVATFKGPGGGSGGGGGGSSGGSGGGAGGGGGGQGGGAGGLPSPLGVSRRVQDTFQFTMYASCINPPYHMVVDKPAYRSPGLIKAISDFESKSKSHEKISTGETYDQLPKDFQKNFLSNPPYGYKPEMIQGTPNWANWLQPCGFQQPSNGAVVAGAAAPTARLLAAPTSPASLVDQARTINLLLRLNHGS